MDIKKIGIIAPMIFAALHATEVAKQAVFIAPVTNLGISAMSTYAFFDLLIPNMCDRAHQALFNEVCEVIDEKDDAVRIMLANVIYKDKKQLLVEPSTFWAPRKALLFFDELQHYKVEQSLFPKPLSPDYFKQDIDRKTIVLTMPWHDQVTKAMYSAGTRFIRSFKDTDKYYGVVLWDAQRKKKSLSRIAKKHARIEASARPEEAQKEFVALLYSWANLSHNVVPYVWGGSSFIYTQQDGNFIVDKYSREVRYNNIVPVTGYDCSELVLRAAQICGMPYFCKVTFVIPEHLRPLRADEDIAAGDLLWYPGHVMVVGDITRNELVESRGYPTGYGKVHVIELNKLFPEVVTYTDLKQKYLNKEPFKLVCKDGSVNMVINAFKIFKLSSIWDSSPRSS